MSTAAGRPFRVMTSSSSVCSTVATNQLNRAFASESVNVLAMRYLHERLEFRLSHFVSFVNFLLDNLKAMGGK